MGFISDLGSTEKVGRVPRGLTPRVNAIMHFKIVLEHLQNTFKYKNTNVDCMAQIKISEELRDDLKELRDAEGHTSYDSTIRELLLHYEYTNKD
jgi:hypothetical protein